MADFINTIDALGDDAVFDSIINRTITEFKDDKVNIIGSGAFHGCQSLTTVDLPNATKAYNLAFAACNALTDVNLPLLTGISDQMFRNCKGLKTISLPGLTGSTGYLGFGDNPLLESVNVPLATEVGTYSFQGCTALKQIDLPSVKKICSGGLQCHNLVTIVLRYNGVCTLENTNAIGNKILNGTGYIYVPAALYDAYRADSKWSAFANQFRKLEEWTVDGTVTGELDIDNRHMVRFFNDDGTLLGYKVVAHGGTAVYDGATPVKPDVDNPEEYEFGGWNPSNENITADTDCYVKWKTNEITEDWATISANADSYKIGQKKAVTFAYEDGTSETIYFTIIDKNVEKTKNGTGVLTFMADNAVKTPTVAFTSKSGVYMLGGCDTFKAFMNSLTAALPPDLQSVMVAVAKYYDTLMGNVSYREGLFIPAATHIKGTSVIDMTTSTAVMDSHQPLSHQYQYFADGKTAIRTTLDGTTVKYWLLTQYGPAGTTRRFTMITNAGDLSKQYGTESAYVVPCFCVGETVSG